MRLRVTSLALGLVSTLALLGAGCGDDDSDGETAPTFEMVFDQVFEEHGCTQSMCHGAAGDGQLQMRTPEQAYEALVGVAAAGAACEDSGYTRVVGGDPENSLLLLKLINPPPCGLIMPITGTIPEEDVDLVRRWIAAGAPLD